MSVLKNEIKPKLPKQPAFQHLVFLLAMIVSAISAVGALPTFWRLDSHNDFLLGETDGVSINSSGTLSLAPSAQVLNESVEPHYWSLALRPNGNVFVGSGNEGRLYSVTPSGEATVIIDSNQLQVHALINDHRGNLYAATSPDGVIYRVDPEGNQQVFFDPEDRYVWSLAVDSRNNLIVGTGDDAIIYRISPNGQEEILFTSEETHIVSLAIDKTDNIFAGTEPNGLVLKVTSNGSTTVAYDTPFQEVRAVVTDSSGNLFAATVNNTDNPGTTTTVTSPTISPLSTTSVDPMISTGLITSNNTTVVANSISGALKGSVYRIDTNGAAEQLWQSRTDTPLSLALATDNRLVLGTGGGGRVFLINQDKTSSLLFSTEARSVTDVQVTSKAEIFLSTSNPAKIYRLNSGNRTKGTYRSITKDTGTISSLGKIRWEARVPLGTTLALQTRTGNSSKPDNTWSDWSPEYKNSTGEQIQSPPGRFFQWRTVLSSTGEISPEVLSVTAIYLQQNLAPRISDIQIHLPGQTFQKPVAPPGQTELLGMDNTATNAKSSFDSTGTQKGTSQTNLSALLSRPMYRKGIQTVTWKSQDPNQDQMVFEVYYRAEGDSLWKLLRKSINSPVVAWDTVAMPDGRYTLKIKASDAPDNPSSIAQNSEAISETFDVDNTPPYVTDLGVNTQPFGHKISFIANDAFSPIKNVEYSVNSGPWNLIFPADGISDSTNESFVIQLRGTNDGGVYTLVIKLTDHLGNVGTARSEVR